MKNLATIYKHVFLLLLFFFSNAQLHSQGLSQRESLLKNANDLVYFRPDEAIKIGKHLLESSTTTDERVSYCWTIANGYLVKGDYNSALFYAFNVNDFTATDSTSFVSKETIYLTLLKFNILKILNLNSQADDYIEDAEELIGVLNNSQVVFQLKCELLLNKAYASLEVEDFQGALNLINKIESQFKSEILNDSKLKLDFQIISGVLKAELGDFDSANELFNKSLNYLEEEPNPNYFQRSRLLIHISRLNFLNKNHNEALKNLLLASDDAKQIENTPLLYKIHRELVVNYLAINDKENYKSFNSEFLLLNNKLELLEQESVNTAFNLISKEHELYFESEKRKHSKIFYIILVLSLILLCVLSFFYFRNRWRKNRLKEIIRYLEISRNVYNRPKADKKIVLEKKHVIPKETEQNILKKLKKFERSKEFTNKNMSLAVLAAYFETNTKYLSEIINTHYQDNFNTYINKLRIDFIIEKLKKEPNYMHYKISYLAEKSGFSSHSSFATVFKSIAGITPVTFIELLKEEKEILKDDEE